MEFKIFSLSCGSGSSYLMFGSTIRLLLIVRSTRLSESIITPSEFMIMMLLYIPIISTETVIITVSPSSFTHSKSRKSTLSQSIWRTATSFPPPSLLRSSIQNIGGCAGFSGVVVQKFMRGEFALAESKSFLLPPKVRSVKTSSSRFGW